MSRIRTIKPEWLDDEIARSSDAARVLSVGLILLSDDSGRGLADPEFLHYRIFPGKPIDTLAVALIGLATIRYVGLYAVAGKKYFALRNWLKHQRIEHPSDPKTPPPTADGAVIYATLQAYCSSHEGLMNCHDTLMATRDPIHLPSLPDLTYTRNKPVRSGRGKTWRRVSPSWAPSESHRELALSLGVNLELEVAKFRDHDFERPRIDPDSTFRNWLRTASGYARNSAPRGPTKPAQPSHGLTGWERKAT